jgi:serine/threonine-protein kinase
MASVYRARDHLLKRDVAVKLIAERFADDPPFVERFRQEARLCARLAHPNILAVLDAGDEPRDFIVMELVDGLDAGRLLQRRGRLTPGQTVHVVVQVCEALQYAHEQGVVHCDLAPPNILLRHSGGTAKLADFGLASEAVDVASTGAEEAMGTPGYVAPEVLWGDKPTPRSDLYSLGVVAYRLLAGPPGFRPRARATSPLATAAPRMPPLAEARPDLPRGLIAAVQQAMALEVDSRQDSVAEFRAQLIDGRRGSHPVRRARATLPEVARGELPRAA